MYRLSILLVALIISIPALYSLWVSAYLPAMHDQYQAERVYEMSRAIAFGQLPPRFLEHFGFGYGYPLFNFYGPFPYYVGSMFYFIGIDLLIATKLMISVAFVGAFLSMYYLSSRWWGRGGGLISAILYTLAPYHAVQLYVRGAIGELYAFMFLPLVVLGAIEIFTRTPNKRNIWISIVGVTMLYLAHTVSMYMALLLLGFVGLAYAVKLSIYKQRPSWLVVSWFLLPLLISCYFWLPAFTEISFTRLSLNNGNNVQYSEHFITLGQLWNSAWGYGGSVAGTLNDGLSFMVGKSLIILALIGAVLFLISRKTQTLEKNHRVNILVATVTAAVIITFLMTETSNLIWNLTPMMNLIQFPWRFLMFLTACLSFIAGSVWFSLQSRLQKTYYLPVFLILTGVIYYQLLFSLNIFQNPLPKFFRSQQLYYKSSREITEIPHLRGEVSAVSAEYLYTNSQLPQKLQGLTDTITCTSACRILYEEMTPDRITIIFEISDSGKVVLSKANYPGFKAFLNGREVGIVEDNGFISVYIDDPGQYELNLQLFDTPARAIGNTITVVTVLILIIYTLLRKKTKTKRPHHGT